VNGWIGVDLDGTLAHYEGWLGPTHIGDPVKPMLARVRAWLEDGVDVRIFTARVSAADALERSQAEQAINEWCAHHLGRLIPITCVKDFGMVALYDDRAVSVVQNTGECLASEELRLRALTDTP
jgi:hypothetical protein